MLADPWFQSWHPPTSLVADQQPFTGPVHLSNFSNIDHFGAYQFTQRSRSQPRPDTVLPYLLSLSLIKPSHQSQPVRQVYQPPSTYQLKPSRQQSYQTFRKSFAPRQYPSLERTGPFTTWYQWNLLDFDYPSEAERQLAISQEEFIPKNNLPLGVDVYGDRVFVSMPKWKAGVPASLAVLPRVPRELSPKLVPYPNWQWHQTNSCDGIVSVFRMHVDSCGRLWVLDSGLVDVTVKPNQICPPKLLIFDLSNDQLLTSYVFPKEFIKEDSLYSNIIVDVRGNDCVDVHAYMTDVWRFGLVVFSLKKGRGWRVTDHLFFPEPLAAAYQVQHLKFEWTDGIFGMALSPFNRYESDRTLYFHPMSSFREFTVKTSVLCNETGWSEVKDAFNVIGQSRGKRGQVSASRIDRNGIMFFNLVTRNSVGCWDTRKPYKRTNLGIVAESSETLIFPNDLKVDHEPRQSVWVISNKLPLYLYEGLNENQINFRIMSAYVDEAVKNSICDPNFSEIDSYQEFMGDEDCY